MKTCKDCKWWELTNRYEDVWLARRCLMTDQVDLGKRDHIYAYCENDEGEEVAKVETGPDFGCIHHKPKEESND